jgi:hypothetical protein
MAGAKSTTLQDAVIKHILGGATYTPATTLYFALFTEEFDEDVTPIDGTFTLGDEVDPGTTSYDRVALPNDSSTFDGSGGEMILLQDVVFPTAAESWGTIKAVAIFDDLASGGDGSDILFYKNLSVYKAVSSGDTVTLSSGSFIIEEH